MKLWWQWFRLSICVMILAMSLTPKMKFFSFYSKINFLTWESLVSLPIGVSEVTELIEGLIQPEENPPLSGCKEDRRRPSRLPSLQKVFLRFRKSLSHIFVLNFEQAVRTAFWTSVFIKQYKIETEIQVRHEQRSWK